MRAERFSVLAAGWAETPHRLKSRRVSIWATDKAFQAIELMRAMHFDLALVRSPWAGESPWRFVRRMRLICPDLKWVLAAEQLHGRDEVLARSMGAWRVMSHQTDADELEDMLYCNVSSSPTPGDSGGPWRTQTLEPAATSVGK